MNTQEDIENQINGDNLYFVCLFDVLGQNKELNEIGSAFDKALEKDFFDKSSKEELDALKNRTIHISKNIVSIKFFLDKAMEELKSKEYWESKFHLCRDNENLNDEEKERLLCDITTDINKIDLKIQQFSDTILIYVKLPKPFEENSLRKYYIILPIIEVFLEKLSYIMIKSFSQGIAIREAATIGMGWELGDRNFYGPVLSEVHSLETHCAKYPRIILSDKAYTLLIGIRNTISIKLQETSIRYDHILNCFYKDDDGTFILDYLSNIMANAYKNAIPNPPDLDDIIKAYEFVFNTYKKYFNSEGKNNFQKQKLANYYKEVHYYFLRNLEFLSHWKDLLIPIKDEKGNTISFKKK